MYKRARKQFMVSAMLSMLAVTLALIVSINLINYVQVHGKLQNIMGELIETVGSPKPLDEKPMQEPPEEAERTTVELSQEKADGEAAFGGEQEWDHRKQRFTAELQYSNRFITLTVNDEGVEAHSPMYTIEDSEAKELAELIQTKKSDSGFADQYMYQVSEVDGTKNIYLLDASTDLEAIRSLILISCVVALIGLILSFIFMYRMSEKAIAPLRESMEKQKRFITDAGHELKTPLSVIGTNMDILALDLPGNEWIGGTKKQVTKLRKMVNYLISLSRMEEEQVELPKSSFDLSHAATGTVESFVGIGEVNGTPVNMTIEENLTWTGHEDTVRQLMTLLADNALKYALPDTEVEMKLYRSGRHIFFETANSWDRSTPIEELDRLFDRFYRGDKSRSGGAKATGFGLGLSIAQAIARKNHLTLTVSENDKQQIVFRVQF